ncbi:hypothetical protein ACIRJR_17995 [Streptomyces sp. NPDC102402]|uniref:hypothetical protein n=1 Tax=Streptomyces sp. NPDC102402 TaxID=3366169 RepID=UPI0037FF922D
MQLREFRRDLLRSAVWGAAALVAVLATGCSRAEPSSAPPPTVSSSLPAPVGSSSAPSVPPAEVSPEEGPDESPEPSPVVSRTGKTKIVTLGDVEVRVTRSELGFSVACNITNSRGSKLNFKVAISLGDGEEWVRSTNFDFPNVAPGQTGRSTTTVMGNFPDGKNPDDPKIYIDSVTEY